MRHRPHVCWRGRGSPRHPRPPPRLGRGTPRCDPRPCLGGAGLGAPPRYGGGGPSVTPRGPRPGAGWHGGNGGRPGAGCAPCDIGAWAQAGPGDLWFMRPAPSPGAHTRTPPSGACPCCGELRHGAAAYSPQPPPGTQLPGSLLCTRCSAPAPSTLLGSPLPASWAEALSNAAFMLLSLHIVTKSVELAKNADARL